MCGIVGGVGKIDFRSFLIGGLRKLDYRGYDSAGLAYAKDGRITVHKTAGTVDKLDGITPVFSGAEAGIAHTRWATHGVPSTANAHPQVSMNGIFYVVHNGVIDNFRALKTELKAKGFSFKSETDTEIIADLLEFHYRTLKTDPLSAIAKTIKELEGSFACAILVAGRRELYFMKRSSPLLLGLGKDGDASYLASDAVPMIGLADRFIDLEDDTYGFLTPTEAKIFRDGAPVEPSYAERKGEEFRFDLDGYPHFMLKEIEEGPSAIHRLIDNYFDGAKYLFGRRILKAIGEADDIVFLACGTSYYASLMGVGFFRELGKRSEAYIASEWAYYPIMTAKRPIFILLSQSGETADLIACQKYINRCGLANLAITNSRGSTIDRKATFSLMLFAGLEVAVASTKSYDAQVAVLALLSSAASGTFNAVKQLEVLQDGMKQLIARREEIHELAKTLVPARDAFYVGRGLDYDAALESALKLKEIAYVHAEAYPGGELKHGPIALIEKDTPVFGFVSDAVSAAAIRNNLIELEARGASVYVIASASLKENGDAFVVPDAKSCLSPILKVMFGQYLAYYLAVEKKLPIDKPRNLAKSVTVQ